MYGWTLSLILSEASTCVSSTRHAACECHMCTQGKQCVSDRGTLARRRKGSSPCCGSLVTSHSQLLTFPAFYWAPLPSYYHSPGVQVLRG